MFRWGGGLPCEGVGAKKFGVSFETQGSQTFWRDIPGFCPDIPGAPKKFEKKEFLFNFWSPVECRKWGFKICSSQGRSTRGRTLKHANERKRVQKSANASPQKSAKGCKKALLRKNCKPPGLKQPGLELPIRDGG